MSMTSAEREDCQIIIHSHAVAAAAGNAVPVPGLGVAVDTITMTTMAMALAAVFGGSITESVAKNMAINAIKKNMLKNPIKTVAKELSKIVPFGGQIVSSSISVAMLESAGWTLAEELSNNRKTNSNSYSENNYNRIESRNNLNANELFQEAKNYHYGLNGYPKDEIKAVKFYYKSGVMGNENAKSKLIEICKVCFDSAKSGNRDAIIKAEKLYDVLQELNLAKIGISVVRAATMSCI